MLQQQALIRSSYGRNYTVEVDHRCFQAVTKGKKIEYVVGDQVKVQILNAEQAQIIELIPRRNLLYRSDHNRSKSIASNLDQLLIIIAVKPNFNLNFLNSCLVSAEASGISPLIIINKLDLAETQTFASEIAKLYQHQLHYPLLMLSAHADCSMLQPYLRNKCSLLIGQSGVGKSTLTNHLFPAAAAKVGAIAKYETSGCHTTTNANLYHLDASSDLIDCPGLQEFGLYHLDLPQVASYFPELRPYLGQCRFHNCLHLNEPGCAVQAAVASRIIAAPRYEFYARICHNLLLKKNY